MSKQTNLFNPIEANGKTKAYNDFYRPYNERIAKEKKEAEKARIEAARPISIRIINQKR